jgi:hypothetical protein
MTPKWSEYLKRQKPEETSPRVGSLAGSQLRDPRSTPAQKSVAGSALTQVPNKGWRDALRKHHFKP